MNINLVKIKYDNTYCYKYKPLKFCCEDLKNAYNSDVYGDYPDIILTHDNIWSSESIAYKLPVLCFSQNIISFYDDDYIDIRNYPINYCPYCGKKLNYFIELEGEDYIELYKKLIKAMDDLQEQAKTTNSDKEYKEIVDKKELIHNKINIFEDIDDYELFIKELGIVKGLVGINKIEEQEKENDNNKDKDNEF